MWPSFFIDFFTSLGSHVVVEEGNILHVTLKEPLKSYFKKEFLHLCFNPKDVDDETELVSRESYITEKVNKYMQEKGEKAYLEYPQKYQFSAKEREELIKDRISFINCNVYGYKMIRVKRKEISFNFKITYLSDEKIEEIVSVLVDEDGNLSLINEEDILNRFNYSKFLSKKPLNSFTTKDIFKFFDNSFEALKKYVRGEAHKYEKDITERLFKNIKRVKDYYTLLLEELENEKEEIESDEAYVSYNNKKLQIEKEFELKIREEIDNHRLNINIVLLSYAISLIPSLRVKIFLDKNRKTSTTIFINLYSGELLLPKCSFCQNEITKIKLCKNNHITCADCSTTCQNCKGTFCKGCGFETCTHCKDIFCKSCITYCFICNNPTCHSWIEKCELCNEKVCMHCLFKCSSCFKNICKEDARMCNICKKYFCSKCLSVCSVCNRIFCNNDRGYCHICGQYFCKECTHKCSFCGEETCKGDSEKCSICSQTFCNKELIWCPHCNLPICLNDILKCEKCEKTGCKEYIKVCNVCGGKFCSLHLIKCKLCEEMVSLDCINNKKYCKICEALINFKGETKGKILQEVKSRGIISSRKSTFNWQHLSGKTREIFLGFSKNNKDYHLLVLNKLLKLVRFKIIDKKFLHH